MKSVKRRSYYTPLHLASFMGAAEITGTLIFLGALASMLAYYMHARMDAQSVFSPTNP